MAMINSCGVSSTIKNTGSECDKAMLGTRMIFLMDKSLKWTSTDEKDFTTYLKTAIHAGGKSRIWPIGGYALPLTSVTNNKEADVIWKSDAGTSTLVRRGMYNRTFMTDKGGLCLAKDLFTIGRSMAFIEVDEEQKVQRMVNSDGTFSGFPTNLSYSPTPELADFKSPYQNALMLDFNPNQYITKGDIVSGDTTEDILSLVGLLDVTTYKNGAYTANTATAASGGYTVVKGATNDTIDVQVSSESISGGPIVQTASETTDTLLATKIRAAINALSATTGYTATGPSGVIALTAPAGLGATINGVQAAAVIVGTITTNTPVPFANGVTGTAVLKVGVKTTCAETDLLDKYGVTLGVKENFVITNKAGTTITSSAGSIVSGVMQLTIPLINDTYSVTLVSAATLKAEGIEGYEGNTPATIVVFN